MEFIFVREDGFYFIDLPVGSNIQDHVADNPGTIKVLNAETGELIWEVTKN